MVRMAIPHLELFGKHWGAAQPWWGPGKQRVPLELDVVAESLDGSSLLIGSVKWRSRAAAWEELRAQTELFPEARGRQIQLCLFSKTGEIGPAQVLEALRH